MPVGKEKKQSLKKPPPGPGPGRPKGVPNKVNALLKDAIVTAAKMAGGSNDDKGLVNYLRARALDTPGPFLALIGKVLPMTLVGGDEGDGQPVFKVVIESAPIAGDR